MSQNQPSTSRRSVLLIVSVLILGLAILTGAQSKQPDDSKLTFQDAIQMEGQSKARLKDTSKFELVKEKSRFVVRTKSARRRVLGTLLCGSCPGGTCFTDLTGPVASCVGCGNNSSACTIRPDF